MAAVRGENKAAQTVTAGSGAKCGESVLRELVNKIERVKSDLVCDQRCPVNCFTRWSVGGKMCFTFTNLGFQS